MTETESISSSSASPTPSTAADCLNLNNLNIDATLTSDIEKTYDLIRRNDTEETLETYLNNTEFIVSLFILLKNNKFIFFLIFCI